MGANPKTAGRGLEGHVVAAVVSRLTDMEVSHQPHTGEAREEDQENAKEEESEYHPSATGTQILHTASLIVTQSWRRWFA